MEDAPAPNALNTYEIIERDGAIYIRGEEAAIKSGQRSPNIRCSVAAPEKVVIVGGYVPVFPFSLVHSTTRRQKVVNQNRVN